MQSGNETSPPTWVPAGSYLEKNHPTSQNIYFFSFFIFSFVIQIFCFSKQPSFRTLVPNVHIYKEVFFQRLGQNWKWNSVGTFLLFCGWHGDHALCGSSFPNCINLQNSWYWCHYVLLLFILYVFFKVLNFFAVPPLPVFSYTSLKENPNKRWWFNQHQEISSLR